MRQVMRATGVVGALFIVSVWGQACSAVPQGTVDGSKQDASGEPGGPDTSAPALDARVPERDASAPSDAGRDASISLVPLVLADVPGLDDFDLTDTKLAVLVGGAVSVCTLPGCATPTVVPATQVAKGGLALTTDRLFFVAATQPATSPGSTIDNVFSVAFDGTERQQRTSLVPPGLQNLVSTKGFTGGPSKIDHTGAWTRSGDNGKRTLDQSVASAGNPDRIGRTSPYAHENVGSHARYVPEQRRFMVVEDNPTGVLDPPELTVTGASVPLPMTDPLALATSPRGTGVRFPTVVILEGGRLKACPTTTDCGAWVDLGAVGTVFNVDGENLYVGNADGLSRCALEEIATRGTCSLNRMVAGAPVESPMYVTRGEIVWKSGTKVMAVAKAAGSSCPPGAGRETNGSCAPCAAGRTPGFEPNTCQDCPRGLYAEGSGATRCVPCPDGTSTAASGASLASACVACPSGETANAESKHLCVSTAKRIFLTDEKHDGDFANDATLAGSNAIAKADSFCNRSTAKPATGSGTYKALMVDGVNRDAPSLNDWVLKPSWAYVRKDGLTPIGTTNASAIFAFPLTSSWVGEAALAFAYFWTGFGSAAFTTSGTNTCGRFSSNATTVAGVMGIPGRIDASSIGTTSSSLCQNPNRVMCVEQ